MIVIGIDPGTTTGFALWNAERRELLAVESWKIHLAMKLVESLKADKPLVIFEDARSMRISGGKTFGKEERLQGVGSVKRDSSIWEDFLEDLGVPYQARMWKPGTTKWSAEEFKRVTGWAQKTNNHARDAAVIVHGLNLPMAQGIVRAWEQRRAYTPTRTSASRK